MSDVTLVEIVVDGFVRTVEVLVPGIPGPTGPTNVTGQFEHRFVASTDGIQIVALPPSPAPAALIAHYINGLRQDPTEATLAGANVTLSAGLNIMIGDFIHIVYT